MSLLYRLHRPLEIGKATRTKQRRDALTAELNPHLAEVHPAPANPMALNCFTPAEHLSPIHCLVCSLSGFLTSPLGFSSLIYKRVAF